jgi:hypothetical protein
MIISDIINKLPDNVTDLWMVMSAEQANTVESAFDNNRIALRPVLLSDGTFTLCCDILAEVGKGGIYEAAFDKFGEAILSCTVLRHAELPWIPTPDINLMDL